MARGLAAFARDVLSAERVRGALSAGTPPCIDDACWARVALQAGASHVVVGTIEKKPGVYRVSLRMLGGVALRILATEENQCESADCSLGELARLSARELARQTLPSVTADVAVPAATPAAPAPSPGQGHLRRWMPIALLAAGVISIATGAYFIAVDGDCAVRPMDSPNMCLSNYRTGSEGWALASGGAAAAAIGGVLLVRSGSTPATATSNLALYPSGLGLGGRF